MPTPVTMIGKPPPCAAYSSSDSPVALGKVVPRSSNRTRTAMVDDSKRSTTRALRRIHESESATEPGRAAR